MYFRPLIEVLTPFITIVGVHLAPAPNDTDNMTAASFAFQKNMGPREERY